MRLGEKEIYWRWHLWKILNRSGGEGSRSGQKLSDHHADLTTQCNSISTEQKWPSPNPTTIGWGHLGSARPGLKSSGRPWGSYSRRLSANCTPGADGRRLLERRSSHMPPGGDTQNCRWPSYPTVTPTQRTADPWWDGRRALEHCLSSWIQPWLKSVLGLQSY